jgi:hypothetical protein
MSIEESIIALDELRPRGMSKAVFVDMILRELPSLIEPDQSALSFSLSKHSEFSHVVANTEHLRHVIRQYYRNVEI